jgi:hypothetical protein
MNGLQKAVLGIGIAVSILLFLLLVWPTLYRYDHMNLTGNVFPVRTYRPTGKTEFLTPSGWQDVDKGSKSSQEVQLPTQDLAKITGTAEITNDTTEESGWIRFQAYNGTEWAIKEIRIELTVIEGRSVVLQRLYDLHCIDGLSPCNSCSCIARLGFKLGQGQTWSFQVVGARGTK